MAIPQVVPDDTWFKDMKKVAAGGKMIPTSPSILETLHTKIVLVVDFSDGQDYTIPEPVLL